PRLKIDVPGYVKGMIDVVVEIVDENIEEVTYSIDDSIPSPLPIDGNNKDVIKGRGMEGYLTTSSSDNSSIGSTSSIGNSKNSDSKNAIISVIPIDRESNSNNNDNSNSNKSSSNTSDISTRTVRISIDTSRLVDGPHTITLAAKDSVGHRSLSSSKFIVDNTPPLVLVNGLDQLDDVIGVRDEGNGSDPRPIRGILRFSVSVKDANPSSLKIILPDGSTVEDIKDYKHRYNKVR
ncbi:MAG: hypothetical protein ACK4FV_07350, partial [Candidatus Nitrosocaldus sp.]